MGAENDYFSVVAMFIMFRETLEAAVIVSILLQCMKRIKPSLMRQVWWGATCGIIISVGFGVVFVVIYYVASDSIFKGDTKYIFKAVMSWVAAVLITWLAFSMLRFYGIEEKYARKLQSIAAKTAEGKAGTSRSSTEEEEEGKDVSPPPTVIETGVAVTDSSHKTYMERAKELVRGRHARWLQHKEKHRERSWLVWIGLRNDGTEASKERQTRLSVWLLSFTAVFREGVETVVFLGGVTTGKFSAIPLAAFVGLLLGLSVGAFVYYTGRQMKNLAWFFILSTLFLFFIAAGLVGWGTSDFQAAGLFGRWSLWYQDRDWWNIPLWDIGGCCSDSTANSNKFFPLVRAIVGYQDRPTALEVILYCSYWLVVLLLGIWKANAGTLLDADWKYKKEQAKLAKEKAALTVESGSSDDNLPIADKDGFELRAIKTVDTPEEHWPSAPPKEASWSHEQRPFGEDVRRNGADSVGGGDDFAMTHGPPQPAGNNV